LQLPFYQNSKTLNFGVLDFQFYAISLILLRFEVKLDRRLKGKDLYTLVNFFNFFFLKKKRKRKKKREGILGISIASGNSEELSEVSLSSFLQLLKYRLLYR